IASHNVMRYNSLRRRHPEVRACAPRRMAARTLASHPSRRAEDGSHLRMTILSPTREDRHGSKWSTIPSRSGLLPNPHPGEFLLEDFLTPMRLIQNALGRA